MRKLLTLLSIVIISKAALAQDISVIAITAPVSGCSLSSTENVTVRIFNYGPTLVAGSSFNVSYSINGGAPVTELVTLATNLLTSSTLSYTFTTQANLSVAGTYLFDGTCALVGDVNPSNDTFSGYSVTCTAATVGGTVLIGTNVCKGINSGTLNLVGQTGSVLSWESSIDGGTIWVPISNTTTAQSYTNLTVQTLYRVQVQNGICPSTTSAIATMTIDLPTVAGTVSGTATVCTGTNGGTMTSTGRTGSVLRWQFSVSPFSVWTDIANITATQTYTNLTATRHYRVEVQNGACTSAFSTAVVITVSPATVGGAVSGGTTVCSGTNGGSLTLGGQTGTVSRWEYSTNAGVTWNTIANTTTSQTYTNLTATRWYRALVKSGACSAAFSTADSVRVVPASAGGTITSSATVCSGTNIDTLTLTGYTGTVQYWEFSTDGGLTYTPIANTTDTLSYVNLITTTKYRANVKSAACASANSTVVTITVSTPPVGGTTASNATVCSGSNGGTITLSGNTGTVNNWESSTDGITWSPIVNTTTSQPYSNLTDTTFYRAMVTNGACPADTSTIDTIIVNPPSIGGTVSTSINVCYGNNSDTLTLSSYTGTIVRWEYSIDGGINWIAIANTTNSYIYTNLTVTTLYRAVVQNGGCTTANSVAATLTIDPVSVGGTLNGGTTACGGSNNGTLTLINYIGTIQNWESSIDGGFTWTPIANTTATQNYLNIASTTDYRVIVKSGTCSNDTSSIATIAIDPATVGGMVSLSDTVCQGLNNGTLTLSGYTGTIQHWELSTDGGTTWLTLANTTTSQNYSNLMVTTIYRAYVKSGVCNGDTSLSATITINQMPVGGSIIGSTNVCEGSNNGTLTLTGYIGTIVNWESSIDLGTTWTSLANTTTSQSYNNIMDTTWYRVIVTNGICGNDTSSYGIINLYPKPQASFTSDTVCFGNATTFVNTSTISSGFIQFNQWDFGDNGSSVSKNPTHVYIVADTFAVSLYTTSSVGCLDTATINVIVNPLPSDTITASGSLQFCAGDSVILSAAIGGYDYMWSNADTTQSITVKISGNYGLIITDSITGCYTSAMETVKVLPVPTVSAGNDFSLSLGSSKDLNATGINIVTWAWFPNTGLNSITTPNPTASPIVTTTYQLVGTDNNGCTDVDSITITVNIDYNVIISNLMTPNDDGYNDRWIIQNIENYPDTKVIVVNREGQEVFKSDSYDGNWDGTNTNGKKLPDGTYYYIVKFKDSDKLYKGAITILKEKK